MYSACLCEICWKLRDGSFCEPNHLEGLLSSIIAFYWHDTYGHEADSNGETPPVQQVMVANINSKSQIVLSGNIGGIRTLLIQLRQFIGHDPHAISHNPIMVPAADYMRLALERIKITFPASVTCISNISALPFQSKENLRNLPSEQCVGTMRWWDSIKYLDQGQAVKR